jgi:hypothetical protein
MSARVWGAHASSRAGDDVLVIANFFSSKATHLAVTEDRFGVDAAATDAKQRPGFQTSTRAACAPQKAIAASCCLTK